MKNLNGSYYLNNSGSRWVIYENGEKKSHIFKTESGKEIKRKLIFCESFGNFASALISYKGQRIKVLFDTILKD
jgi:hypothetical protein